MGACDFHCTWTRCDIEKYALRLVPNFDLQAKIQMLRRPLKLETSSLKLETQFTISHVHMPAASRDSRSARRARGAARRRRENQSDRRVRRARGRTPGRAGARGRSRRLEEDAEETETGCQTRQQ